MATLKTLLGGFAAISLLAGGMGLISVTADNTAHAQTSTAKATVDAAIKRGEVGEQINGYLGIVKSISRAKPSIRKPPAPGLSRLRSTHN